MGNLMPSKLLVVRDMVRGNPSTAAAHRRIAETRAAKAGRQVKPDGRTLLPYVWQGKWVADCPHCRASMMLDPDWPEGCCLGAGCYRVFTAIEWPSDRDAIEAALVHRPIENQNWGGPHYPKGRSETVADLHEENVAHGLERCA